MLKYESPNLEVLEVEKDVITTSIGTETTKRDEADGIWDFDQG